MNRQEKNSYAFGHFRLDVRQQVLFRDDEIVPLAPKALDLLVALVENSGHVVSKDELMKQVWPNTFVEEANLSRHIFALRKALEDDKNISRYIETIPRRGYRFVGGVVEARREVGTVVVEEHSRSRIVIEEETQTCNGHDIEVAAVPQSHFNWQDQPQLTATSPARGRRWLSSRKTIGALITVGLLVVSGGAYLIGRGSLKSNDALTPNRDRADWGANLKLTRLTSFRKGGSSISPDGRFVCYMQNYDSGPATLWLRQVGTNKEIQLIEPGERVFYGTAFSPDGQFIYYSAIDRHDPHGALFRVPVLGGPPTRLLATFGSMFTLSPDGREVTFYRYSPGERQRSLIVAAVDGSSEQVLLTFNHPERIFTGSPSWSPDGQRIAFAASTEREKAGPHGRISLFTIDVGSREVRSLTSELWRETGRIAWTYDGKTLFFVASRPSIGNQLYYLDYSTGHVQQLTFGIQGYGNYGLGITADGNTLVADGWETTFNLWTIGADGVAARANRLTTGLDDGSTGVTVLADGRIAYASRTGDNVDLWTMKPDGTDVKPLTADSYAERDVASTADGRYLVFVSNRTGGNHLFRMDNDGSDLKQLTSGDGSDSTPDCSPDGEWVVYASRTADKSTLWKVPIDGGSPIQLTDYHSIEPSFSPNGKLISCILPESGKVQKGSLAIIPSAGGLPLKSFQVVQFAHYYVTPRWSLDGQAVVFTEIKGNAGNLWKQSLSGGPPEQLTDFKTDLISNFAFSRDGKSIILARGPKGSYVVLIRDFK